MNLTQYEKNPGKADIFLSNNIINETGKNIPMDNISGIALEI